MEPGGSDHRKFTVVDESTDPTRRAPAKDSPDSPRLRRPRGSGALSEDISNHIHIRTSAESAVSGAGEPSKRPRRNIGRNETCRTRAGGVLVRWPHPDACSRAMAQRAKHKMDRWRPAERCQRVLQECRRVSLSNVVGWIRPDS